MPRAAATGCMSWNAASANGRTGTGSGETETVPDSILERSMISSTSASRCSPATWIMFTHSPGLSSSRRSRRSSLNPMIAASGVRSSWLIRDRNSFFALLALRSPSFVICSCCDRRTISASIPAARSRMTAAAAACSWPSSRRRTNSVTSSTRWMT